MTEEPPQNAAKECERNSSGGGFEIMAWFNLVSGHGSGFAAFLTSDANVSLNHAVRADCFVAVAARKPCFQIRVSITMIGM